MQTEKFCIVVHGGGGAPVSRSHLSAEKDKAYRDGLTEALNAGHSILKSGGTAMDGAIAAAKVLEDNTLFNAGKGSVFTKDGIIEMEATIMDGKTLMAGAVTGLKTIKNPIEVAHLIVTKTNHVMLMGESAEAFAILHGLKTENADYFYDENRWKAHLKGLDTKHEPAIKGTIGVVTLDKYGNLAVTTSTGGKNNKMTGRIGDSGIIGSGTYCNNKTCGISCTGTAEYYMRLAGAHDISAMMEYAGKSLKEATDILVLDKLKNMGGDGGVIGLDCQGNIAMPFIEGMLRGYMREDGTPKVFLYDDERGKEFV